MTTKFVTPDSVWADIEKVRAVSPLVHNITNYVVMDVTANALLAVGASPVMAHALQEVEQMTTLAHALVLNIGTLSENWIEAMLKAQRQANKLNKPVVLDPVGLGATEYRAETISRILNNGDVTVIRGNASEIGNLCGMVAQTKGVDSTTNAENVIEQAENYAKAHNQIIAISGATDYITNGTTTIQVENGNAMMGKVTGMGCTATAMIGAFLGVNENAYLATVHAMIAMGIAGERAAQQANGPGSFRNLFMDQLYSLSAADIDSLMKVPDYAAAA